MFPAASKHGVPDRAHVCGHIELCSTYEPGILLEMNRLVWNQAATNIDPAHACKNR